MSLNNYFSFLLNFTVLSFLVSCSGDTPAPIQATKDEVVYSFVVMGNGNVELADTNLTVNPSTSNYKQINQSFKEIALLNPKPEYVFFLGDMVLGLIKDSVNLENSLKAFADIYNKSVLPAAGIKLVAVPGEHELEYSQTPGSAPPNIPWDVAERVWLRTMSSFIAGSNGPGPGSSDVIKTDQSKLTYSFNSKGYHFIILNTDTYDKMSYFPVNWVVSDIQSARANNTSAPVFVMSHKPAYPSPFGTEANTIGVSPYTQNRDLLWQTMETNHVTAMFAAHEHLYNRRQINNKVWQIIDGNAGAKLDAKLALTPSLQFFGYSVVAIYKTGKVELNSSGRGVPDSTNYLGDPSKTPTYLMDSYTISW